MRAEGTWLIARASLVGLGRRGFRVDGRGVLVLLVVERPGEGEGVVDLGVAPRLAQRDAAAARRHGRLLRLGRHDAVAGADEAVDELRLVIGHALELAREVDGLGGLGVALALALGAAGL